MRWIKHETNTLQDKKLAPLISIGGLEAYGFYWRVMEILASNIEDVSDTSVTFSAKIWGNLLGISTQKFKKMLEICSELGIFDQFLTNIAGENFIKISAPSLLYMADEYTARKALRRKNVLKKAQNVGTMSGECRDNVGTMSGECRVEKRRIEKRREDKIKHKKITTTSSKEEGKEISNDTPTLDLLFRDLVKSWPADRIGDINAAREIFSDFFPQGLSQEEASERLKNIEKWASIILEREPQYVTRLDKWLAGLDASISPPKERQEQPEWVPVEEVDAE